MTIAEFREFFFRSTQVNSGAKPDKETGYPTQYAVDGNLVGNRLLKGHFPSENTFKKLAQSITFKLNAEDAATTTQQGLVKTSADSDVISKTSSFSDSMIRVVQPYQIPDVEENDTMDIDNISTDDGASGIVVTEESFTIPSTTKTRKRYLVRKKDYLYKTFTNLVSVLTNNTTLWTKEIPLKAFQNNGDTLIVDIEAIANNVNTNVKDLILYIDSTPIGDIDIVGGGDSMALGQIRITKQSHGTDSVVIVSTDTQFIDGSFVPTTRTISLGNPITLTGKDLSTTTMTLGLVAHCADAADVITVIQSSIKLEKY